MNRERPPFEVVPGQSPAAVAAEIVAVCEAVAARPDKLQWVERETTRRLLRAAGDAAGGDPAGVGPAMAASARASRAIAASVDAAGPGADRNPYHDRQHLCEVMLVACFLGRLHRLPPREAQRLLLAALVHDLDHDGRPGGDFRAERRSVIRASAFLRDAGVEADESRRLAALVLATEPTRGTPHALAAAHARAGRAPAAPSVAPELEALSSDATLARLAVLLCEADLLPSTGLTPAHGQALQRRLASEWQRPLGRADKRRFLDGVLAGGVVGDFFRPNVVAFRATLDASADGPPAR